ncbi:hypothetical protein ACWFQ8_29935 [Streptomyces sp. NPDC055254]
MSQQFTPALPAAIVSYLAEQEASRARAVNQMMSRFTDRELALIKEAAVMGYVQGMRHHDLKYPGDRQVVFLVADACRAFADLYPTIAGWTPTEDEDGS